MVNFIKAYKTRLMSILAIAILSVTMFLSSTVPAFAASGMNSPQSNMDKGEAKLDQIYGKSEDNLRNPPLSMDKVKNQANEGINEVQGAADESKMKNPSNSQAASSVEERIEEALDKVTNKS